MSVRRSNRHGVRVVAVGAAIAVACGSGGQGASDASGGGGGSGGASSVQVTGTDALEYAPSNLTAAAGTVTITLRAEPATRHTVVIEELDDREVVAAEAGAEATGTVDLEPGEYTFYCDVPGHRPAGMEGTLTVS